MAYLLTKLADNGELAIFEMNADLMDGIYRAGKGHSLTEEYAKSLGFQGFEREVNTFGNGKVLQIKFRKVA